MIGVVTRHFRVRAVALVLFETVLIVFAVMVAVYIRLGEWAWQILTEENGVYKALIIAGVAQICLYYGDMYDMRILADRREMVLIPGP